VRAAILRDEEKDAADDYAGTPLIALEMPRAYAPPPPHDTLPLFAEPLVIFRQPMPLSPAADVFSLRFRCFSVAERHDA